MKQAFTIFLISLLFTTGCQTPDVNPQKDNDDYSGYGVKTTVTQEQYTIEVESDPPGARIEVDEDYLGQAPKSISVTRKCTKKKFTFAEPMFFCDHILIRALPTRGGHCVQTKILDGDKPIPARLFFDTRLCPQN